MKYLDSIAKKVAHRQEGTFIRTSTILVPATAATVARTLDRLVEDGTLIALDRGLWFKPYADGSGPNPIDTCVEVMADLGIDGGFGPTGPAALALLELGPWPQRSTIAVSGHTLTPVGDLDFVHRSGKRKDMKPADVAVLEILRDWPVLDGLGWRDFTAKVVDLHAFGQVSIPRVARGARSERVKVVKERAEILVRAAQEA